MENVDCSHLTSSLMWFCSPDSPLGLKFSSDNPEPNQSWHITLLLPSLHWFSFKFRIHPKTPFITYKFLIWHGTYFYLWLVNSFTVGSPKHPWFQTKSFSYLPAQPLLLSYKKCLLSLASLSHTWLLLYFIALMMCLPFCQFSYFPHFYIYSIYTHTVVPM